MSTEALQLDSPVLGRRSPLLAQSGAQLTSAERAVLELLRTGLANKEIASALGKAEPTIKHQVSSILQKHRVPSRARLIALLRQGYEGQALLSFSTKQ